MSTRAAISSAMLAASARRDEAEAVARHRRDRAATARCSRAPWRRAAGPPSCGRAAGRTRRRAAARGSGVRSRPCPSASPRPGLDRLQAEHAAPDPRLAAADQAGNAEHLAGAHVDRRRRARPQVTMFSQRQQRPGPSSRRAICGIDLVDRAAGHQFDQRVLGRVLGGETVPIMPAIAQDADPVGDLGEFLDAVGDVDDADALCSWPWR